MGRPGVIAALVLMMSTACAVESDLGGGDSGLGDGGEGPVQVGYRVEGPARASITYTNKNGDSSQDTNASLPWTYKFSAEPGSFTFLYVSAQNSAGGTIVCIIEIDGQVTERNRSRGQYAICTASGDL